MAETDRTANVAVEELVVASETGARDPVGWQSKLIPSIAFAWALFQLYFASNLPFTLTDLTGINFIINLNEARYLHLSFAIVLASFAFPLFKNSSRTQIPWYDWLLAALGVAACCYLIVFKNEIAVRAGLPTTADLVISTVGMAVLAITVFRSLGIVLVILGAIFVAYVFFGHSDVLPDVVRWKGASYGKAMWHYWMQTEGVFGKPVEVSTSLIFLFVLFGAILERAGAGNFFIKIAFGLLGHMRGGPAKAAVVASGLSGIYSGSSIANTVSTGTFTIPLMKRTGFPAEKAGAVEVAASTNGQLTPPVMGAAAFLIAEYTGIPYTEIIKHALVPALVSYIALFYIVHLEALKLGLQGLPKPSPKATPAQRILGFLGGFIAVSLAFVLVYYGLRWISVVMPDAAFTIVVILVAICFVVLLRISAGKPDLEMDNPNDPIIEVPRAADVALTGMYFFLPIVVLIWCIVVERLSPSLSAFWAAVLMICMTLTQRPLKAFFRKSGHLGDEFRGGVVDLVEGMISGSRNMIGIGIATGAAGIIVGTISLTGAHQVVGEFVEFLSGGHLLVMLVLVALMSLILGMGLPTTANYIVVSSLMAPVIVTLGAKSGLVVPLVAVHLFVFYFGILADDTPPVGLAAMAAAGISKGDPIRTGLQGFTYDIRTALLPFLFIFNTELLLIDVGWAKGIFVFVVAVIAMMLFAAATQGYFFVRNKVWETVLLLMIAFTLFRPGFWLDLVQSPFDDRPGGEVIEIAGGRPADESLRVQVRGPDFDDPDVIVEQTIVVPLGQAGDGAARLERAGLLVSVEGDTATLEEPLLGTTFAPLGQQFEFYGDEQVQITLVKVPVERMWKEVFYIPALLMIIFVIFGQRRRRALAGA